MMAVGRSLLSWIISVLCSSLRAAQARPESRVHLDFAKASDSLQSMMALELSLKFLSGTSKPPDAESKAFRLDDELEPLDEEDYSGAVDLFEILMAIRHLDTQRRVNVTTYLSAHGHNTTYSLTVNGIEVGVLPGKLEGFTEALERAMDKVEAGNKEHVGTKSD